jgi:opacity protein-like surface antigen
MPAFAADYGMPGQGTWYLRGDVGVGIADFSIWNNEVGIATGIGVGYRYNELVRTDLTFDAAFDYDQTLFGLNASLDAYSIMMNGYLDVPTGYALSPYIGAGIGYGWLEAKAGAVSANGDGIALAAMAGVSYDFSQNITLDLGYKFRTFLDNGEDFNDHLLRAGVRFNFN